MVAGALALAIAPPVAPCVSAHGQTASPATKEVFRDALLDGIYGGWVGMLIGGLPHEFKYNERPSDTLPGFTFLEKGARLSVAGKPGHRVKLQAPRRADPHHERKG